MTPSRLVDMELVGHRCGATVAQERSRVGKWDTGAGADVRQTYRTLTSRTFTDSREAGFEPARPASRTQLRGSFHCFSMLANENVFPGRVVFRAMDACRRFSSFLMLVCPSCVQETTGYWGGQGVNRSPRSEARRSSSGVTRSQSGRRRLHRAVGWHPAHACSPP